MTSISRIILGTAVLAYCLVASPASFAGYIFDLDLTRDNPAGGGVISAGGGVIDLPSLTGNTATNVILNVGFEPGGSIGNVSSYDFTQSDIQSIAWTIASDTTTLSSLNLNLSRPLSGFGTLTAGINITNNSGTYGIIFDGGFIQFQSTGYATSTRSAAVPVPPILMLYGIGLVALGWSRFKKG